MINMNGMEEALYPFSIAVFIPPSLCFHLSSVDGIAGLLEAAVPGTHFHPTPTTKTRPDRWDV
jgi:hypothetical protein